MRSTCAQTRNTRSDGSGGNPTRRTTPSATKKQRWSSTCCEPKSGIFFFQAEDGIRDLIVTGVQTCALPISPARGNPRPGGPSAGRRGGRGVGCAGAHRRHAVGPALYQLAVGGARVADRRGGSGRGACRGRGWDSGGGRSFKKKE